MKLLVAGALLVGSAAFGAPCPDTTVPADTYYLQSATQIILSGPGNPNPNPLSRLTATTKTLQANLRNLDTINYASYLKYAIPLNFRPNCLDSVPANVTFWQKDSGRPAFSEVSRTYPRILYWDTNQILSGHPEYYGWFGFYPDIAAPGSLSGYLGRLRGAPFENWYGAAVLADSSRATSSSPWQINFYFSNNGDSANNGAFIGPVDSAYLDNLFFTLYGWRNALSLYSTNRHPFLYMQTIKLSFDTVAPATLQPRNLRTRLSFSAWQQGNMVWIHAGRDLAVRGGTVELYDMFGRKTAELRPSGDLYAWNGKNLGGSDASPGLYFARTGNRVLGKFVYGR